LQKDLVRKSTLDLLRAKFSFSFSTKHVLKCKTKIKKLSDALFTYIWNCNKTDRTQSTPSLTHDYDDIELQ